MSPAVNSTVVPYITNNDSTPCFVYTSIGSEESDGAYIVSETAEYKEPTVFEENGITLTLVNYKFAYGNRMSDKEDNPYSI